MKQKQGVWHYLNEHDVQQCTGKKPNASDWVSEEAGVTCEDCKDSLYERDREELESNLQYAYEEYCFDTHIIAKDDSPGVTVISKKYQTLSSKTKSIHNSFNLLKTIKEREQHYRATSIAVRKQAGEPQDKPFTKHPTPEPRMPANTRQAILSLLRHESLQGKFCKEKHTLAEGITRLLVDASIDVGDTVRVYDEEEDTGTYFEGKVVALACGNYSICVHQRVEHGDEVSCPNNTVIQAPVNGTPGQHPYLLNFRVVRVN